MLPVSPSLSSAFLAEISGNLPSAQGYEVVSLLIIIYFVVELSLRIFARGSAALPATFATSILTPGRWAAADSDPKTFSPIYPGFLGG